MVSTTNDNCPQMSSPNQRVGGSIPSRRTIGAGHRPAGWRSSFTEGRQTHLIPIFCLRRLVRYAGLPVTKCFLESSNSPGVDGLPAHVDVLGHRGSCVSQLVQTAWVMLHRYRSVMVRPGRDRLRGDVEVDESFLGGPEPGVPGRGAVGKVLFAGAVELDETGFGRPGSASSPTPARSA